MSDLDRCESGDPTCGKAIYEDDHGVRLCQKCYDGLERETATQHRARELGIYTIDGGKP